MLLRKWNQTQGPRCKRGNTKRNSGSFGRNGNSDGWGRKKTVRCRHRNQHNGNCRTNRRNSRKTRRSCVLRSMHKKQNLCIKARFQPCFKQDWRTELHLKTYFWCGFIHNFKHYLWANVKQSYNKVRIPKKTCKKNVYVLILYWYCKAWKGPKQKSWV